MIFNKKRKFDVAINVSTTHQGKSDANGLVQIIKTEYQIYLTTNYQHSAINIYIFVPI